MFYAKLFGISTICLTLLYYWATQSGRNPLPLWPDSMIIGGSVSLIVCAVAWRFRSDRKAVRHMGNLRRLIWRGRI